MKPCTKCSYIFCDGTFLGHYLNLFKILKISIKKYFRRVWNEWTSLDYSQISDIEVDGIELRDYPKFCDAYIASATYKGRPMTDDELDRLNDDSSFVYDQVLKRLY